MQLSELLGRNGTNSGVEITGLSLDSRTVESGYLFAALKGREQDGKAFIPEALKRGAVAVLTGPEDTIDIGGAVHVVDPNPRRCLAGLAARYYRYQPRHLAAVTGTNGKTSVVCFVRQLLDLLERPACSIGTLGVQSDVMNKEPSLTTLDILSFQQTLAEIAEAGIEYAAFEASSHGLSQHRVDGAKLEVAAFTNLTRDHLDYHQDFEEYFYAKARLFGELLPPTGTAVIACEVEFAKEMEAIAWGRGIKVIKTGRSDAADLELVRSEPTGDGQNILVKFDGQEFNIEFPLIGEFQAINALTAAAIVIAMGLEAVDVIPVIEQLDGIEGRLEKITDTPAGGRIYVDYAHTPHGLETLLMAVRPHTSEKLHVVFGCGGDRDKGKRAEMGAVAQRLADQIIITDDNPRSEEPATIRKQILAAAPGAKEIGDRTEAIAVAAAALEAGDVLVVTGKGHERGQIVKDKTLPFYDLDAVKEAIALLQGKAN